MRDQAKGLASVMGDGKWETGGEILLKIETTNIGEEGRSRTV
jgi:hypothetical protein